MRMKGSVRYYFRPFYLFYIKQLATASNKGQAEQLAALSWSLRLVEMLISVI